MPGGGEGAASGLVRVRARARGGARVRVWARVRARACLILYSGDPNTASNLGLLVGDEWRLWLALG